jgi:hypothetical protein
MNCLQSHPRRAALLLGALAAVLLCASLPSSAQVPPGLMRFGTTGSYAPQVGDCLDILALNSSGQVATDNGVPCTTASLSAAYTNATAGFTSIMVLPTIAANAPPARGECTLIWEESNTGATPSFAVQLSAAPTDLWVLATYTNGAYVAPTYTTITSTTQTAVTGALTTTTANAAYKVTLNFLLDTTSTAAGTLTVYGESSGGFTLTVEPGSYCQWIP